MDLAATLTLFALLAVAAGRVLRPADRARAYATAVAAGIALAGLAAALEPADAVGLLGHRATLAAYAAAVVGTASRLGGAALLAAAVAVGLLGDESVVQIAAGAGAAAASVGVAWSALRRRPLAAAASTGLILTAAALTVAALAGPRLLVTSGRFWTSQQIAILPALTLGTVLLAACFGVAGYGARRPRTSTAGPAGGKGTADGSAPDRLAAVATAVGLVVAVTALSSSIGNVPPPAGAVPGCPGVQVHAVPFLAKTPPDGANVRSGPSSITPQMQRLGGGCSVGVLGFCRGEPLYDLRYPVRDSRWYVLPHGMGLISSTAVLDLSAASSLRPLDCPGQVPAAGVDRLRVAPAVDGEGPNAQPVLMFTAAAPAATNLGVAIYRPTFPVSDRFRQILLDTKPLDGAQVAYGYTGDAAIVRSHTSVIVVATPCLAAGVPDGEPVFQVVRLPVNGQQLKANAAEPDQDVRTKLLAAACRYQFGEGIPVVPAQLPTDGL